MKETSTTERSVPGLNLFTPNYFQKVLKVIVIAVFILFVNRSFADIVAVNPAAATIETFNENTWTSVSLHSLTMSGFTITGALAVTWNSDDLLYYAIVKVTGASPNFRHLVTVDPNTGVCTDIGMMDATTYSTLTYNSSSGILYTMTGSGQGSGGGTLYSVNMSTAATTYLGGPYNIGTFGEVIAYNFDDDMIYHWSNGGMEKISPSTFTATPVTMSGASVSEVQGAVYKGSGVFVITDLIFAVSTNAFTITSAGAATSVVSTLYQARGFGFANPLLPVELSSFASAVNGRNVELNWTTTSETNNSGFDIERSNVKVQMSNEWIKVGNVAGNGTTTTGHSYSYTDRNLATGKYNYRLKQTDFNGNFEYFNLSNEVVIGIPTKFELSQNYPNPFNPTTNLEFGISELGFVSLKVYDASGQEVATLVNEMKSPGYYSVYFDGSILSSGIYFYTISSGNFTATKKMTLLK